jgi:DNA repair exonuclease SbcCD nuclease subunit
VNYRFLFTADLHLCNSLPHSRVVEDGETDRLRDQLKVLDDIGRIARDFRADAIFILGDVYERRLLDAITLRAGLDAINELARSAPTFILPGNHDAHSVTGERSLIESFESLGESNVRRLDGKTKITFSKLAGKALVFYPVPWGPIGVVRDCIARWRAEPKEKTFPVLLFHRGVNGCKDGGWTCEGELGAEEVCVGFEHVFAGDFHEAQKFGACGEYVGAPLEFLW